MSMPQPESVRPAVLSSEFSSDHCATAMSGFPFLRRAAALSAALIGMAGIARAADLDPQTPFPDFGFMAAQGTYTGTVFKLSQDYPTRKPDASQLPAFFSKLPTTFSNDFSTWREYMMAVKEYCFEGNLGVDWRVENNTARKWYHIPWQHYGPAGREGIHGLTKEAAVKPNQLAIGQGQPTPNDFYQTYAVGFYNEFGGYGIGRVWADHMKPDTSATNEPHGFPNGTVVSKLLFVDVPVAQVPSLVNPTQWQGYIQQTYNNANRSIRTVSLIQMDIAVRDDRVPDGWLFGTFQYNGALNQPVSWDNLIPVGIMWGNDPTVTDNAYTNLQPAVTKINPNLTETAINADPKELPPTHLGWNGRLNGPVDNPMSSCLSCHMTAEVPTLSPLNPLFQSNPPPVGSAAWMRWFANTKCGVPFDKDAQSTDFSLQLAMGIENFYLWETPAQSGLFASDYQVPPVKTGANAQFRAEAPAPPKRKHYPIERDVEYPGTDQ
jgi:hypothetical protein